MMPPTDAPRSPPVAPPPRNLSTGMVKRLRLIGTVDPRSGGPIEGILQQAPHNLAAGIIEHVVTLDAPDAPWVREFPLHVIACGAPLSAHTGGWRQRLPWRRYGYQPDLVPWLKAHVRDYDEIVVHGLWNYSTMAARRVLVGAGRPYVVFSHGMLDPWFQREQPLKGLMKQIFWWFNEGPLLNSARYVLFTSEEERLQARQVFCPYRVRERVVKYGTSDPQGDPATQLAAFQARVPALHKPYLLFLSRIHPKKGCDLLIDAFAEIHGAQEGVDLVLAGPVSEEMRTRLQAQAQARGIAGRIHWLGMLSGDAKWGAFRGAQAFVLPSHQENFGIAVAEALACGCPVLISDKVNIWREVVEDGGGMVAGDDSDGTSELLARFDALSPAERTHMGERARICFLQRFEVSLAAASINAALIDASRNQNG